MSKCLIMLPVLVRVVIVVLVVVVVAVVPCLCFPPLLRFFFLPLPRDILDGLPRDPLSNFRHFRHVHVCLRAVRPLVREGFRQGINIFWGIPRYPPKYPKEYSWSIFEDFPISHSVAVVSIANLAPFRERKLRSK